MFHGLHTGAILITVQLFAFVSVCVLVYVHDLGNESGIYGLHMSLFLYRLISYVNPRLWHNHIIPRRLFAQQVPTTLDGPQLFSRPKRAALLELLTCKNLSEIHPGNGKL